ncbi:outer membrane protein assembly factor BamB [Methylophaga thiooxydans]|uniref:Outer membrane protein assembly factor BamB n=1 Tax=Methylophaga thiooxydans DMS010 TaxID=637616 RepID=C0N9U7_9GAMM|nr:outer membrane protein assembly factor BamB [Methylophaga thiooxydans]EEF78451.1 outer membrane assembly lipoprotein YfgL [Methylophaga thiooxydans DMS010]
MKVNQIFRTVIASGLVLLSGCSAVEYLFVEEVYEAPPTELTEFTNEFQPQVIWDASAGDGAGETKNDLSVFWLNGKIFAVDYEGEVSAFNAETGRRVWETELDVPVIAGIGGGMDLVIVGTQKGQLIALNEADGEERWRARLTSEVLAPPTTDGGMVVSRTADGRVTAVSADSGEVQWSYQRAVPLLSLRGAGAPVIAGDNVIAGYDNGKLVALSLSDGKVVWEKSVAVPRGRTELDRLVDIDADPVVKNDNVYVVTYQGNVSGLDLASGQVLWSREMSSQIGLDAAYGEAVYISDDEGYVWAVQDGSGDALWRQTRLLRRQLSAPAVVGDYVVVGDLEGYVHWLARNDGRFVARQQISDAAIRSKPFVKDGVVYITALDGSISAVRVP